MSSLQSHWDTAHSRTPVDQSGWFEPEPRPSLELIGHAGVPLNGVILDVGSGASTLTDHLLDAGYQSLVVCDISAVALELLDQRLGKRGAHVRMVAGDILAGPTAEAIGEVDVWHDRAMFHFLVEAADRARYRETLKACLKPGGNVVLATFAPEGAEMCSGLPVERYDEAGLQAELGEGFELLEARSLVFTQPSGGLRPFTYTLFRRV